MGLYADLEYRGIIKQVTDPTLQKALQKPLTLYCGFDPTSDSLHVGSLLPLLTLKRFQQAGHHPIAVMGGATGMIGDPSGKTQERQLLTEEILAKNLKGISGVISKFLDLKGPSAAKVVNNADFFKDMDYIQFLRDIGKHFTINYMMAKESVRARLEDREHGISYTEFSYMLLQAYDYYRLNRDHGCTLQIGGSDQWGNITAGIELIRRMRFAGGTPPAEDAPADSFGMTHPLVSKADGTKFGKSEKGNVWLDPNRTHPNEFYQFFIQTADADVLTYLKFFTFLSKEKIEELARELKAKPEARTAQKALARELTVMVHGEDACARAEQTASALFGGGGGGGGVVGILKTLKGTPKQVREELSKSIPDLQATGVAKEKLGNMTLLELLVETKLSGSKGAARKDIEGGGIYLNDERVSDVALKIEPSTLIQGLGLVLRKGKKTHHFVYFE